MKITRDNFWYMEKLAFVKMEEAFGKSKLALKLMKQTLIKK